MYYDLFEKIKRGSIMLWNVEDEKELPKRKEMIRLLGTENFTYYKSHGHHKDYIRVLAKLSLYVSSNALEKEAGYWAQMEMSHFLFTDKEIESNSFFLSAMDNVSTSSRCSNFPKIPCSFLTSYLSVLSIVFLLYI